MNDIIISPFGLLGNDWADLILVTEKGLALLTVVTKRHVEEMRKEATLSSLDPDDPKARFEPEWNGEDVAVDRETCDVYSAGVYDARLEEMSKAGIEMAIRAIFPKAKRLVWNSEESV